MTDKDPYRRLSVHGPALLPGDMSAGGHLHAGRKSNLLGWCLRMAGPAGRLAGMARMYQESGRVDIRLACPRGTRQWNANFNVLFGALVDHLGRRLLDVADGDAATQAKAWNAAMEKAPRVDFNPYFPREG